MTFYFQLETPTYDSNLTPEQKRQVPGVIIELIDIRDGFKACHV